MTLTDGKTKDRTVANMSKKITTVVVSSLVILVVAIGIIVFISQKPQNAESTPEQPTVEPIVEPLTLEEAQTIEINTSNWKTYESEDGIFELRYPERIENISKQEREEVVLCCSLIPTALRMSLVTGVHLSGLYVSPEIAERMSAASVTEVNGNFFVLLFDKDKTVEDIKSDVLEEPDLRDPTKTNILTTQIGDQEYTVIEFAARDYHRTYYYITELPDGRVLYIQSEANGRSSLESDIHWTLDERVIKEIIASIIVK